MRPMHNARWKRARSLSVAAVVPVGVTVLALAASGGQAAGQTGPATLSLSVPHQLRYGATRTLSGATDRSQAGHPVVLDAAASATGAWHQIAGARISRRGRFHFRFTARRSMLLRAVESPAATGNVTAAAATVPAASRTRALTVIGRLTLGQRPSAVVSSGPVRVGGQLLPAHRGQVVTLQGRSGHAWHTLAVGRTGRRGRFTLRGRARRQGERLRVAFAGDALAGAVSRPAGRTAVFTAAVVSWYNDAGQTACGFHAGYGVASRTLPCGTRLTFRNGGRTVTATVDDRGPYVYSRSFDLNQNTAAALGFGGVGTVWVAS